MRLSGSFGALLLLSHCASPDPVAPLASAATTPAHEAGDTPDDHREASEPASVVEPTPAIQILQFLVTRIDSADLSQPVEDGSGNLIQAFASQAAVQIDLHADRWPGRALDPVLEIGNLRFHRYQFPAPGVMRFIAADRNRLPDNTPVVLRWGDEAIPIADHLPEPIE